MYVSIYIYRLALQKVCIGRQSPVQPHRRARSAGIKKAANEMSLNRSAHSQTNRYILSPFCEVLLCKAMRRRPAARGKYLKGGELALGFACSCTCTVLLAYTTCGLLSSKANSFRTARHRRPRKPEIKFCIFHVDSIPQALPFPLLCFLFLTLNTLIMQPVAAVCDFLKLPASFDGSTSGGLQMAATSLYRSSVWAAVYLEGK